MNTIVTINHKGGVGKTFVSSGLAVSLAQKGNKVLLIDTDAQGNLSRMFGIDPKAEEIEASLFNCLNNKLKKGSEKTSSFISHTEFPNIDILVGDVRLTANRMEVERALTQFDFVYQDIVSDIADECDYNYIIIDTPPSLGGENSQVMMAADYLIIPTTTGLNSIEGINTIIDFYNNCRKVNRNLKILGIVLNAVMSGSTVFRDVFPAIQENYGDYLMNTRIERSVVAEKIEWNGVKPANNKIFRAFSALADEVVEKIGH